MDKLKEAFLKIKEDIDSLKKEMQELRLDLLKLKEEITIKTSKSIPTYKPENSTITINIPTDDNALKALKEQNLAISTGNRGVPTNRQTDKQTDQQTENWQKKENSLEKASEILNSFDSIKKDIRLKFKRITDQELLVFSTIYQLDEEIKEIDYKVVANKLNLSESSIRDYVGKLIKKGIPVEKKKINNKKVLISISNNLKRIASLSTILKLRDL